MHSVPATQFSLDPGDWQDFLSCLNDDLTFTSRPNNTAIPVGGKLVEIKHKKVNSLADVRAVEFRREDSGSVSETHHPRVAYSVILLHAC